MPVRPYGSSYPTTLSFPSRCFILCLILNSNQHDMDAFCHSLILSPRENVGANQDVAFVLFYLRLVFLMFPHWPKNSGGLQFWLFSLLHHLAIKIW